LVLQDEVPPNGREIEHTADSDVLAALASRFKVEEVADLTFAALLTPLASDCLQASW
jgi:hypothetical protein